MEFVEKKLSDVFNVALQTEMVQTALVPEDIAPAAHKILNSYSYKGLNIPNSLDFNKPAERCAYVYLYSTCHTYMVYDGLSTFMRAAPQDFSMWLNTIAMQGHINICSIGGGPGSDIIGILSFLQSLPELDASNFRIRCTIADAYKEWEHMSHYILNYYYKHFNVHTQMNSFYAGEDLLKGFSKQLMTDINNAEIVSMVKFLSAIDGNSEGAAFLLKRLFTSIKPGCAVLFIDNNKADRYQNAVNVAHSCGMEAILGPMELESSMLMKHFESDLHSKKHYHLFEGLRPKTSASAIIVVWVKPVVIKRCGLKRRVSWTQGSDAHSSCMLNIYNTVVTQPTKRPRFEENFTWRYLSSRSETWDNNKAPLQLNNQSPRVSFRNSDNLQITQKNFENYYHPDEKENYYHPDEKENYYHPDEKENYYHHRTEFLSHPNHHVSTHRPKKKYYATRPKDRQRPLIPIGNVPFPQQHNNNFCKINYRFNVRC